MAQLMQRDEFKTNRLKATVVQGLLTHSTSLRIYRLDDLDGAIQIEWCLVAFVNVGHAATDVVDNFMLAERRTDEAVIDYYASLRLKTITMAVVVVSSM